MAPSITIGAVMPPSRKPATRVVVFQWPWGIGARQRWPRGARPRSLAIFVEAPFGAALEPVARSRLTIHEDKLLGVETGLHHGPGLASRAHVLARLLARMARLF